MKRLEGKIALVTGAARGIGAAIADAFAQEGARVYRSDIDLGPGIIAQDVTDENRWRVVIDDILAREGRLDILVNNAGITGFDGPAPKPQDPEHCDLETWRHVHAVNLDSLFLGCKYALRAMRKTGRGSIINMSSRSGMVGIPRAVAYASSKAAIRNHTKSVALYCAEEGLDIRCNAIMPAAILTPMWEQMLGPPGPEHDARKADIEAGIPMGRFGLPQEVASVAVMLASDESSYITGAEFVIDGGILAGAASSPSRAGD